MNLVAAERLHPKGYQEGAESAASRRATSASRGSGYLRARVRGDGYAATLELRSWPGLRDDPTPRLLEHEASLSGAVGVGCAGI
jgi:hypothetical protein